MPIKKPEVSEEELAMAKDVIARSITGEELSKATRMEEEEGKTGSILQTTSFEKRGSLTKPKDSTKEDPNKKGENESLKGYN